MTTQYANSMKDAWEYPNDRGTVNKVMHYWADIRSFDY